jgi:hypothetical protein
VRLHPGRNHWSPVDQRDPGDADEVLDGDLDRWKRLKSGPNRGKWRNAGFSADRHEAPAGEDLVWHELVYRYAPLTEATEEDQ